MADIRAMTVSDLDEVAAVTEKGGFGNRRDFFRMTMSLGDCTPVVAVERGHIVGTGVGAAHGLIGWVGVIFVVPELRGRGLGKALTEAVCDDLATAGCDSLLLVATDMGRPVYEKLGFRIQTEYNMFSGEPLAEAPRPPRGAGLRLMNHADLDAVAAMDSLASGEDRRPLIDYFASSGWVLESVGDATLRGFLLPTSRGNAAVIAPDPEDADCLLDLHRHLTPVGGRAWAGLASEHTAGRQMLTERGWFPWRTFPRMVRGEDAAWEPSMVWGQFNHAMG